MVRSGQASTRNLQSVAIPRPLGMAVMLASMMGDHQRLAWSIVACCADPKVKLQKVGAGAETRMAYVIDKNALMLRSGNRLANAARDLAAVVEKAIMRSEDPALDGKPMFRRIDYQRGVGRMMGGKIVVQMGEEALMLMTKKYLARVPVDPWRGLKRQVAFALLVRHYCELGPELETSMPSAAASRFVITKDRLGWWSEAAGKGGLGQFKRDHLVRAIADLNDEAFGSLIEHRGVTAKTSLTAEAWPKVVSSIKYRLEPGANGEIRETLNRHLSAKLNTIDVDARKDLRQKAMKRDFAVRKAGKRTTANLRAEIRAKIEVEERAKIEAEVRTKIEAEVRAELAGKPAT